MLLNIQNLKFTALTSVNSSANNSNVQNTINKSLLNFNTKTTMSLSEMAKAIKIQKKKKALLKFKEKD